MAPSSGSTTGEPGRFPSSKDEFTQLRAANSPYPQNVHPTDGVTPDRVVALPPGRSPILWATSGVNYAGTQTVGADRGWRRALPHVHHADRVWQRGTDRDQRERQPRSARHRPGRPGFPGGAAALAAQARPGRETAAVRAVLLRRGRIP